MLTPGTLSVAVAATPRTAAPDRYSGRRPPRGIARTSRIVCLCTRARARHHPIHFLVLSLLLYDPLTRDKGIEDGGRQWTKKAYARRRSRKTAHSNGTGLGILCETGWVQQPNGERTSYSTSREKQWQRKRRDSGECTAKEEA